MKKLIILFFMLVVSMTSQAEPIKTLRFATEASYPPFEYINANGNIAGFDIEIAMALCQQMHAKCTFSNQSFNSLIPSLKLGKFDVIIAALGITAERQKEVDFTPSYYEPSASFIAAQKNHYTLSMIKGKIIGVQQGSVFEKYLRDTYGNTITTKYYSSIQDAFLDLVLGRLEMVIVDTPIATAWLKQNNNAEFYGIVEKPIIDETYFGSGYGIAIRKNNLPLWQALNKALQEIKANGTYAKILKKYFGYTYPTSKSEDKMPSRRE